MKDILNFEGLYQIDENGNILNVSKQRVFKPKSANSRGYVTVDLFKDGNRKGFLMHRLIAQSFIPNPLNLPFINHINGIKTDNRVENLEWCSASENTRHSFKIGLQSNLGSKHPQTSLSEDDVLKIRSMKDNLSIREISNLYNVSIPCIRQILNRTSWRHI